MEAVDKVIDVAKSDEGYLEKSWGAYNRKHAIVYEKEAGAGKDNITKYWEDTDRAMQGQFWCQVAVYNWFVRAYGKELAQKMLYLDSEHWKQSDSWHDFYTPNWSDNFKANGAYVQTSKARAGDIVYFKNSQRVHHTGLVLSVTRDKDGYGELVTIEGNTASSPDVVANGGSVRIKKYTIKPSGISSVAWYGRPNYDLVPLDIKPLIYQGIHDEKPEVMPWVRVLQDSLNKLGIKDDSGKALDVDGKCGSRTVQAIKTFQRTHGLPITGKCNDATWEAIDHALTVLTVKVSQITIPAGLQEYDRVVDGYYHLVKYDIWVKG